MLVSYISVIQGSSARMSSTGWDDLYRGMLSTPSQTLKQCMLTTTCCTQRRGLTESQLPASWPLLCSDWRHKTGSKSRDSRPMKEGGKLKPKNPQCPRRFTKQPKGAQRGSGHWSRSLVLSFSS